MRPRLSISRSAVELIMAFEGFRAKAAGLDDGRWTLGYGHTLTAREGAEVTEPEAEALLLYDLIPVAHAVNEHVFAPLNQNQFDALVSFVFNIGVRAFRGSPTLRRLNEGRPLEGALAMEMWRKSDLEGERIVVDALVRRRAAEKALFLRPTEGWTPAPTPVLPPKIDYDVSATLPLHTPIATHAPLAGVRAFAERAPEDSFEPSEEPSASSAAAAAVIERLEALLPPNGPEPLTAAPLTATALTAASKAPVEPLRGGSLGNGSKTAEDTPPKLAATDAPFVVPLTHVVGVKPRRRRPASPLIFVALAAVGVALFAAAAFWAFQSQAVEMLGAQAETARLAAGVVGVGCLAVAIYFLLERLGLPRDRT